MIPKLKTLSRKIPASIENIDAWQMSRRHFVKGLFVAGALVQIPFLSSCLNEEPVIENLEEDLPFGILSSKQKGLIKAVQNILFPDDGNGPSAADVNALDYLQWVISDSTMDPDEVEFIVDGTSWFEEACKKETSESFLELNQKEQDAFLALATEDNNLERWLSVLLTLIFEALFCDPKYGGNPSEQTWEWLNHNPGLPRPTDDLIYNKIVETIRN